MKIMKARNRNVVHDANGTKSLRLVMANRFKKNHYTHIQINNAIYSTSIVSGIVWVDDQIGKW
jgi:hypothetical protein